VTATQLREVIHRLQHAGQHKPGDADILIVFDAGYASTDNLTADEIRALLQLEPNATCGFVRQTYLSALSIAPSLGSRSA